MKRFFITMFIILVCFLLQTTAFQRIALAGEVPNLILIVTVAIAYMRGKAEGMYVGLACGLLVDIMYGDVIGLHGMLYMFLGYFIGICNEIYYKDDLTVPIVIIAISDFLYNFSFFVLSFLLRGRLNIFFYIRRIMLPELVYTVLIAVILYKLLHFLNDWLERSEYKEVL